jgi:hypothetical protein
MFVHLVNWFARARQNDAPTASKVYHAWFLVQSAIEGMEGLPDDLKKDILRCIAHRWDYGYTMIHGAGYVLDPPSSGCASRLTSA